MVYLSSEEFIKKKRERQLINDFKLMELREKKLNKQIEKGDAEIRKQTKYINDCMKYTYIPNYIISEYIQYTRILKMEKKSANICIDA